MTLFHLKIKKIDSSPFLKEQNFTLARKTYRSMYSHERTLVYLNIYLAMASMLSLI
jgi:hypothetical protein